MPKALAEGLREQTDEAAFHHSEYPAVGTVRNVRSASSWAGGWVSVIDDMGKEHPWLFGSFDTEELLAHPDQFEIIFDGTEGEFPGPNWVLRKKAA